MPARVSSSRIGITIISGYILFAPLCRCVGYFQYIVLDPESLLEQWGNLGRELCGVEMNGRVERKLA